MDGRAWATPYDSLFLFRAAEHNDYMGAASYIVSRYWLRGNGHGVEQGPLDTVSRTSGIKDNVSKQACRGSCNKTPRLEGSLGTMEFWFSFYLS